MEIAYVIYVIVAPFCLPSGSVLRLLSAAVAPRLIDDNLPAQEPTGYGGCKQWAMKSINTGPDVVIRGYPNVHNQRYGRQSLMRSPFDWPMVTGTMRSHPRDILYSHQGLCCLAASTRL